MDSLGDRGLFRMKYVIDHNRLCCSQSKFLDPDHLESPFLHLSNATKFPRSNLVQIEIFYEVFFNVMVINRYVNKK